MPFHYTEVVIFELVEDMVFNAKLFQLVNTKLLTKKSCVYDFINYGDNELSQLLFLSQPRKNVRNEVIHT